MKIRLRESVYREQYLLEKRRYNRLLEGIIDLADFKGGGFAEHNRKITKYCLRTPENLIQALIFCIASQGVTWNVVASLYRIMYEKLLRDGTLYLKGHETDLKYDAGEWRSLLGKIGERKISSITYLWKNQKEIFNITKYILKPWSYNSTTDESKDAVIKLFDYYTRLPQLGLAKAGFAVQLVTGALGCFDSVNANIYSNLDIPKDIYDELLTRDEEGKLVVKRNSSSEYFETRVKKLKAYSDFLDIIAKDVGTTASERLWDVWVSIVSDRINNTGKTFKDAPTIITRGKEILSKQPPNAKHDRDSDPIVYDWEEENVSTMTPDKVSAQHHPTYLAYGEYAN
jgi:hypothetical protein